MNYQALAALLGAEPDEPWPPAAEDAAARQLYVLRAALAGASGSPTKLQGLAAAAAGALASAPAELLGGSMLPLVVDDGEVTICTAISGRADQAANMPRRLTLLRRHADGTRTSVDYAVDPAVFADPQEALNASEAVYGFAGWLTSRRTAVTWSENHEASSAANAVAEFIEVNGLPAVRDQYAERLKQPPEPTENHATTTHQTTRTRSQDDNPTGAGAEEPDAAAERESTSRGG